MPTVKSIRKDIEDFFGDTTRSRKATHDGLGEIASLCETYMDALVSDAERGLPEGDGDDE